MKKTGMRGTKTYWVAQNRASRALREVFRTREEAVHFVDHQIDGWEPRNSGRGWAVFQCAAIAEWSP